MTNRVRMSRERIIRVRISRSGRAIQPWNFHVTDGVGIVGESGSNCTAWTRRGAIRAGLKVAAGCADNHITYGETPVKIEVDHDG